MTERCGGLVGSQGRVLRPAVSVVVEARGREADVQGAIDSVRDQDERRLEILVVLVDEFLRGTADDAASGDWRVRVLDASGADPAAARRAGAEAARGERLLFLPPRQRLLARALPSLRRRTAEVVAGAGTRPLLGRLLVAREAWLAILDDGEPAGQTAALGLLARPHETLAVPVLDDHGPLRPRPFEPQVDPLPGLRVRMAFDRAMLDLAEDRAQVAAGLLARDLPPFLDATERCDDAQWVTLRAHVAALVHEASAALADVPVEDRVLAWLVAEGRRDDAVSHVASRRFTRGQFPTVVRDGLIRAELGADVPDHLLALTESESPLKVHVARVSDEEIVLWTGLARLDEDNPQVMVTADGTRLEVERSRDAAVTRWMGEAHQRHDLGVVTALLPPGAAAADLEVEVTDRGVRRRARVAPEAGAPTGRRHPDLTDDEAGPYRQHLLQREYSAVSEPLDPRLVYFQAFLGQPATDHTGAIQEALNRARPDGARMLWGVADSSVAVPEGAEPVLHAQPCLVRRPGAGFLGGHQRRARAVVRAT